MNEKISIIVPVYNAEKTLHRCVDSLIGQTYSNIEIILVDDGSKDHSLAICQEYAEKDSRVIVVSKINGGVSSARNTGLDRATGIFVMFCDSDDWVESNWCEELASHYDQDCLVMCGYYSIQADGRRIEERVGGNLVRIQKEDYLSTKMLGGFAPWNKIYSRNVIETYKLRFPENLTIGEDRIFVWRYLQMISGDIICLGKCLNYYIFPQNNSLTINLPENYYLQCDEIFHEITGTIKSGFKVSAKAKKAFYNECYWEYERSIKRVLELNKKKHVKIRMANQIMRSDSYQECALWADISTNRFACKLCRMRHCYGVLVLKTLKKY